MKVAGCTIGGYQVFAKDLRVTKKINPMPGILPFQFLWLADCEKFQWFLAILFYQF